MLAANHRGRVPDSIDLPAKWIGASPPKAGTRVRIAPGRPWSCKHLVRLAGCLPVEEGSIPFRGAVLSSPRSSSGQDVRLSISQQGFDSPTGYQHSLRW